MKGLSIVITVTIITTFNSVKSVQYREEQERKNVKASPVECEIISRALLEGLHSLFICLMKTKHSLSCFQFHRNQRDT